MKIIGGGVFAALLCCAIDVASADESSPFKTLVLDGHSVRWQRGVGGEPRTLSYSVVTETVVFPGARNCRKMTTLEGLQTASAIASTNLRAEIVAAFAMWQATADIRFHPAEVPSAADILIGAQLEPEGWAFADVFYDVRSPEAIKPVLRALICLNPVKRWKIGFDGDLSRYDLRYTFAHEIGHAIGLDHPGHGQIMGYRYEEHFRELQAGDIAGAITLYGKRRAVEFTIDSSAASAATPMRDHASRLSGEVGNVDVLPRGLPDGTSPRH